MIAFDDFEKVDIRVGRVIDVQDFPRARKPSYRVKIDFGEETGIRGSSLQEKNDCSMNEMLGKFVVCVVNFEPKNIAPVSLGGPGPGGGSRGRGALSAGTGKDPGVPRCEGFLGLYWKSPCRK